MKKHGERISDIAPIADNETGKMKFVGWSTSMSEYIPYETSPDCDYVTYDLSIYAIWKRWREVAFVIKEGDERVERVYQGEPFTIPDYENPGYVNDGWFRSERFDTVPETTISYESAYPKYYSRWEIAIYTIVYHSNSGETFENKAYRITDSFNLPVPAKEGYVFKGWCEKEDYSDTPVAEISAGCYGNKTFYAKFMGSVALNAGEGHVSSAKADIVYDKKMTFEVPWLSGYAFAGWFDADGNRVTDSDGKMLEKWIYADLSKSLNAKFSEKLYITIEYYYPNSGNVAVAEYYAEGQEISLRAVAAEGYTFKGFYDTQNKSLSGIDKYTFIMGNADITLKVLFEPAEYAITFNTDGGYCRTDKATVKYHCEFVLPIAYKDGKRFDGWLFDGTKITDADGKAVGVWDFLYGGMVKASFVDDDRGMITIRTADDFMKIIEKPDGYYNVLNDIDLSGRNWVPFDFSGTISGDDVTIKNVFAESDSGNLGIFLKMSGTIKNINFANVVIRSTVYDSVNVGGLCAVLSGSIENVKLLSGSVMGENCTVGGFAAVMENGSIINCENRLDVTGKGNADTCATGGIVGIVKNGTLSDLQNIGKIIGVKYVGGIFGKTSGNGVKIERLANHAEIEATGSYVGGVAGYYSRTGEYNMFDFGNSGNISGGDYVGGIFGSFMNKKSYKDRNIRIANVKKINNGGNVTASGNYAGGLFGYLEFEGVGYDDYSGWYDSKQALNMEEAENSGNVSGAYYVGGLIGYGKTDSEDTLILKGKSRAEITATAYVGGLMGYASNFILNTPENAGSTVVAKGTYADGDKKYAYYGGYVGYGTGMKVNDVSNAVEINYQTSLCTGSYVGGIFGYLSGVLTNCTNTAAVNAPNSSYVGGIAGIETQTGEYTMSGLSNTGAIGGSSYVGGIFGSFMNKKSYKDRNIRIANVKKVNNSGNVAASGNYAGGLFGYLEFEGVGYDDYSGWYDSKQSLNMEEAENSGNVTGAYYVGGLIGYGKTDSEDTLILKGKSRAEIEAMAYVGGLMGYASNFILNTPENAGSTVVAKGTYADGDKKYAYYGGYVGYGTGMKVNDAANAVEIDYKTSLCKGNYVGGMFGYISGVLTNCTNTAAVNAPNSSYVGGIAGIETQTGEYTMSGLSNTGAIGGSSYVGGIFGSFMNKKSYKDRNIRIANVKKINNGGNVTASGNYAGGLFGYLEFEGVGYDDYSGWYDSKQSLNMEEAENSGSVSGVYYVGGLIGYGMTDSEDTLILEGKSRAAIEATAYVGGLMGYASNFILNTPENAGSTVVAKGTYADGENKYAYYGGYVGYGTGMKVNDAANAVEIDYKTSLCKGNYVGGMFGYISGVLTNCTNTAAVNAPNSSYVGGIAGIETQTGEYTMSGLTNAGAIGGSSYVGGIFGSFMNKKSYKDRNIRIANVKKINNGGNVTASGNYAGGLFGYLEFEGVGYDDYSGWYDSKQSLNMEEAENSGDVTGVEYVGGLIGCGKTDSEQSEIVIYTQTGKVSGETNTSDLIGKAENLTLTE